MIRQSDYVKELVNRVIGTLDSITSGDRHRMGVDTARALQSATDDAKLLRLELEKPLRVDCQYPSATLCKHFGGEL